MQPPRTDRLGRLGQRDDLGVGRRIAELLALVVGLGHDPPLIDDHAPDRHIAVVFGDEGMIDGDFHIVFIRFSQHLFAHSWLGYFRWNWAAASWVTRCHLTPFLAPTRLANTQRHSEGSTLASNSA